MSIEWDWTLGPMIQILVFIEWCYNIIMGFLTLDPWFGIFAVMYCFWFLVAPWCISEYIIFLTQYEKWRGLSSIYGKISHDRFMAKYSGKGSS